MRVHDQSVEAAALRACASLDMVCWSREGLELLPWDRKRWSLQQNIVLRLVKKTKQSGTKLTALR